MIVAEAECILSQLCPILTEPTSASLCVALSAFAQCHSAKPCCIPAILKTLAWSLLSESVQRSAKCTRLADSRVLLGLSRATPLWSLNECLVNFSGTSGTVAQVAQRALRKKFCQEVQSMHAQVQSLQSAFCCHC